MRFGRHARGADEKQVAEDDGMQVRAGDEKQFANDLSNVLVKNSSEDSFIPATIDEEKAIIRKLDLRLIPFVFVLYISVLGRLYLGNAKLAGLEKDVDLSGNRYEWLGTIFYIACKYCFLGLRTSLR